MTTQIFISPWIDLTDQNIRECIRAGAHSARIHTGKHNMARINSLIDFYAQEKFRFYLDLRGNKASVNCIDTDLNMGQLKLGERVLVYAYDSISKDYFAPWGKKKREFPHCLGMNFLPQAVLKPVKGNFAMDDGKVLLGINKLIPGTDQQQPYLECAVIKAGKVFPGDGVSSTDIFIHSGSDEPFSTLDIVILKRIPEAQKHKVKFIAVSFVESARHIIRAQEVLCGLGFKDFQIVPKVETIKGIKNLQEICAQLVRNYGPEAEVQIGRGDLCLDCGRRHPAPDFQELTFQAVATCNKYSVKASVLALVMESVHRRFKQDRSIKDLTPNPDELQNILKLDTLGAYQIGFTSDFYIDRPERLVRKLRQILKP